jgi:hypothetical protein
MKHFTIYSSCLAFALLGACEGSKDIEGPAMNDLQINSAKRQCVSVAVLQQVPQEAAQEICECTVDTLIDAGKMGAEAVPSDAEQQSALDTCIDNYEPRE